MRYTEFTAYSPLTDCNMVRISTTNADHEEVFALVPELEGKAWRTLKKRALEALEQAVDLGMVGEIRWRQQSD
jgi:hypothetical protein